MGGRYKCVRDMGREDEVVDVYIWQSEILCILDFLPTWGCIVHVYKVLRTP